MRVTSKKRSNRDSLCWEKGGNCNLATRATGDPAAGTTGDLAEGPGPCLSGPSLISPVGLNTHSKALRVKATSVSTDGSVLGPSATASHLLGFRGPSCGHMDVK